MRGRKKRLLPAAWRSGCNSQRLSICRCVCERAEAEAEEVEWRVKGENTPPAGISGLVLGVILAGFTALFNRNCTWKETICLIIFLPLCCDCSVTQRGDMTLIGEIH